MRITSFIHPKRAFLPCSGVGRHMNGALLSLAALPDVHVDLLFSRQWLQSDGLLPMNCPLRNLRFHTFPMPENITERMWKLVGLPRMNYFVPKGTDWVYCPMETRFPATRCPVAVTIHDIKAFEPGLPWSNSPEYRQFRRRWGYWIHKTIRDSALIFTVSEFTKRRMVELLAAPPEKIVVSGNGVDERYWAIGEQRKGKARSASAQPYALIVGGLRRQKGAEAVLAVARVMQQTNPDFRFEVVGESEPQWVPMVEAIGNIRLRGFIDDQSVDDLLANATALLFLSEYEGFGIPPLEAMAAGVPSIVANRASLPEVVGDSGYIVEPTDAHGIADLLQGLANGSQRYDVEKAATWAARFTWAAVAGRVYAALGAPNKRARGAFGCRT